MISVFKRSKNKQNISLKEINFKKLSIILLMLND